MNARRLKDFVSNNGCSDISTLKDALDPVFMALRAVKEAIKATDAVKQKHSEIWDKSMQYNEEERRLMWMQGSMLRVLQKLEELVIKREDFRKMWRLRGDELILTLSQALREEKLGEVVQGAVTVFMEHVSMLVQDLLAVVRVVNELLDSGLGVRGA